MDNSKRAKQQEFEYVLNDFLEVKAEVDPKRAISLKNYLLSMEEKNLSLSPIEGFRLNGHLILIEKRTLPEKLVFFNPDKGSIQIKQIPS